jgi:PAS domain S-box-containing protein
LAICIYQDDYWVYTNQAGEKMSGYSAQELYQKKYWEFVAPEYQELVKNNGINRLAGKGEENPYEFRIITKGGEPRWVILTGSSITYNERPAGIITVVDITEWKKAEVGLLDASHKMNAFFEQSLDGFFFMTMDQPIEWNDKADKDQLLEFIFSHLKITRVNDAMLSQYGADRQQFLGITPNDFFVHDIEQGKNVFLKILENGKLHTETDERKLNGEPMFVEGDYTCLYDSDGRMTGLFGIQRDITASRKMTEILQESESKYRYLFENNPAPMWIYDLETLRFLEVNDTAIIQYGYSREEFLRMTLKNIRPEEDIDTLLKDVEQTVTPFNKAGIWRHIKKNGEIIFVEITSHQIEFDERPARLVIINDISERKKIEESLVGSENSLKEAQIIANMGDWEFDLINNKSKWSENCYRLFGLDPFEIIPTYDYFRSRVHQDDLHLIDGGFNTLLHTKSPIELELRISFADNRVKWIVNKIIPVFVDDKIVLLKGVNIDITEKKAAEEQLRLLSKSIEQSPVSMVITDVSGAIEYVNYNFTKNTGYTKEEALGKNPRVLKSGMHDASFYDEMWKTLLSGQPWIGEILNRKKNGELYWENAIISPILNTNGEITHFLAAKEDITEKKKLYSDLIKEKERAEESDRLKSAFLANMSHEIRTPLNSIIGFSELLTDPDFEEEQKNEFIQLIITNGNNLLTIISDIMDISKLESGELKIHKKQINAQKFVSKVKSQFAIQVESRKLEFSVLDDVIDSDFEFVADSDRLMQVFNNLISNALKFTAIGSIEIGYQMNERMLEFYVRDTGIGIPAEYHDKIFDRFRQVEAADTRKYGGNGLGLAITKNLVELMGGNIWLESEVGKGSTFYFSLPSYIREF